MSSLFYLLFPAISRRNWFYIILSVNYRANTPHHSLLLPSFSLIPTYSQFQHLSSKAHPCASCSEQQGYTNHKLPQHNNPVYQSAFHSTSHGRQALMLATGGKQFHFDTSKQNSVSAAASPVGQMPKLHPIVSDLLPLLFASMSSPTFVQALQPVVDVQMLLLSKGLRQETLSRIPSWCKMGESQTHPLSQGNRTS